jgi:acid phosphatase
LRRAASLAFLAALLAATMTTLAMAPAAAEQTGIPAFDRIFMIVMENHTAAQIVDNTVEAPYFNQVASAYGLATNSLAVAHPSLPNYLALTGGDTFGITDDCTDCFVSAPNLVADRIVPSGRTWKAYMESMPSTCFAGDRRLYAQKHNPFFYYDDIRLTGQCQNIVPFSSLLDDLASVDSTPDYVWITPNLCNDMHDCSISAGDAWLAGTVPEILSSPAFTTRRSLLLITFDEDDYAGPNVVPVLVVATGVSPGFRSTTRYSHYSLLRTVEDAWGLAPLTSNDAAASPLTEFFSTSS